MNEKYQCAVCDNKFKTIDAVDGFKQGYKVGFLCPFCKSNIMEAGEYSNSLLKLRFGPSYAITIFLAFLATKSELNAFMLSGEASAKFIALATFIVISTGFLFYINIAVFRSETILYTRKVTD